MEALQSQLWRQASPTSKMDMLAPLNSSAWMLALAGLRAQHPQASEAELRCELAGLLLGKELARKVQGEANHAQRIRRSRVQSRGRFARSRPAGNGVNQCPITFQMAKLSPPGFRLTFQACESTFAPFLSDNSATLPAAMMVVMTAPSLTLARRMRCQLRTSTDRD